MRVIIVGAGPSGLVLSLLLANAGIDVVMLDAEESIDSRPRAAHYAPSAIRELKRAGVLDDVRSEGFIPGNMCWRRLDGSKIVEWEDSSQRNNPEALTVLHIADLLKVLLRHVEKNPRITVKFHHNVTSVSQNEKSAWAIAKLQDGKEVKIEGDYLTGCDGSNSIVRRTLFGDKFEGHTWNTQIIATNVYYDGFEKHGFNDINFIIHPQHFCMCARITRNKPHLWRVSYGEDASKSIEEARENQPKKYEIMLPGSPKPGDYDLVNVGPYRIHQRCAEKFRVGRITIAADAAHLCNPFGGMGLTGGIVDVGGLADCLVGIETGQADESILDKYDEVRRHIYKTLIDTISSGNFIRVSSDTAEAEAKDEMIQMIKKGNEDPEVKKEMDAMPYAICHDFTQYYKSSRASL